MLDGLAEVVFEIEDFKSNDYYYAHDLLRKLREQP